MVEGFERHPADQKPTEQTLGTAKSVGMSPDNARIGSLEADTLRFGILSTQKASLCLEGLFKRLVRDLAQDRVRQEYNKL